MSTKKMQKSLDNVKADVRELAQAFWALRDEVLTHHATTAAEQQSSTKRAMPPQGLDGKQPDPESAGYIGAHGHYEMSDSEGNRSVYRWSLEEHPVEGVLDIEVDDPARVLAAIGHKPTVWHINEGHAAFLVLERVLDRDAAPHRVPEQEDRDAGVGLDWCVVESLPDAVGVFDGEAYQVAVCIQIDQGVFVNLPGFGDEIVVHLDIYYVVLPQIKKWRAKDIPLI